MSSSRVLNKFRAASKVLGRNKGIAFSIVASGIAGATLAKSGFDSYVDTFKFVTPGINADSVLLKAMCASSPQPQNSVISETKNHAVYLTIHLDPKASPSDVLKALAQIEKHIDRISPIDIRDDDNEILAGVGFGPNFLKRIYPDWKKEGIENFSYEHRKGGAADMPATGGDIFIHAKCHERGKLFELTQAVMKSLPEKSVTSFEDIYGWVYRYGRDLSGFIDGTENPADPERRAFVALNPKTAGSYSIAQKWIHKHNVINTTSDAEMEKWIGRTRADSVALRPKPEASHVARVTGTTVPKETKPHEIVRQSQPYGTVSGDSGLFFIAYAKTPEAFNYMLDMMSGASADGHYDHVFHLSDCKTGSYFYFPSQEEMSKIYSGFGSGGTSSRKFW